MNIFSTAPTVSVLRLNGVIGNLGPMRGGLSLATVAPLIERAFRQSNLKAVALALNSPGGSPVQSALIFNRLRAMAEEKDVPVLTFAEDVAASGGYWIACAGDEIYANENSIVGSIGVVSAGFGLEGLIDKIGVERRLYTSGERKSLLDPFLPEKEEDVERLKGIQGEIHESFKELVRRRRGKRLKLPEKDAFSGEFWTGKTALKHGLIDGIGDLRAVLRDRFGERVKLKVMEPKRGWLRRKLGMGAARDFDAAGFGQAAAGGVMAAIEERAHWHRFGL